MWSKVVPLLARLLYAASPKLFEVIGNFYNRQSDRKLGKHLLEIFCSVDNMESGIALIQVGSNDHSYMDPFCYYLSQIFEYEVLLIEPVPVIANRLQTRWANKRNITILQCAVGNKDGFAQMWVVDDSAKSTLQNKLPPWWDNIASFNPNHIDKHLNGKLSPYKRPIEVEVKTLDTIVEESGTLQITFLHIDAEGHDLHVLNGFSFKRAKPVCILIEYIHLNDSEVSQLEEILKSHQYTLYWYKKDVLAVQES